MLGYESLSLCLFLCTALLTQYTLALLQLTLEFLLSCLLHLLNFFFDKLGMTFPIDIVKKILLRLLITIVNWVILHLFIVALLVQKGHFSLSDLGSNYRSSRAESVISDVDLSFLCYHRRVVNRHRSALFFSSIARLFLAKDFRENIRDFGPEGFFWYLIISTRNRLNGSCLLSDSHLICHRLNLLLIFH